MVITGKIEPIRLVAGDSFIVNADSADSHGLVHVNGAALAVPRGGHLAVGPFRDLVRCTVETLAGSLSVVGVEADPLTAEIVRRTERVASAVIIATAINERDNLKREVMGLQDKMKRLADRARAVPAAIDQRAESLFARLDQVEARGSAAFTSMGAVLDDVEAGVRATEDAVSQITNGAPVGESYE